MIRIKNNFVCILTLLLFLPRTICAETVTITTPANSATVVGQPLSITGTSSLANYRVRLTINTTVIGSATTNVSGNWNFTLQDLSNGNYSLTADLISNSFEILATDTNTFTAFTDFVTVTTPEENESISTITAYAITGTSSIAAASIRISIDSSVLGTATSNGVGNWQTSVINLSNGAHVLLAELLDPTSPSTVLASATRNFSSLTPVVFPSGINQIRIVEGDVPTTGSGSGNGYSYSVSGSIITITFTPSFSNTPQVIATGQRTSGSSTVTISSISSTACNIGFSTGTQRVHFTATSLT